MTFQVGPYNQTSDQVIITIAASSSTALGVNAAAASIGSTSAAAAAMSLVQSAIGAVAQQAAQVGATQNQITSLAANLTVAQQNIQAAHSNLVDVNVAQASTTFAQLQILEQTGVAVLAQANQLPALATKLV
jgi:flagellin